MRQLRNLWKAFDLLGSFRDIAYESTAYHWEVAPPASFYLDAEHAAITLARHEEEQIAAQVKLRASFAWTLATEQDRAGVYLVLRRKPVIGDFARARLALAVPQGLHISLRLRACQLRIEGFDGELELPPPSSPPAQP